MDNIYRYIVPNKGNSIPKLQLPQLKRVLNINPDLSLMDNLLTNDVPVASSCAGDGICGKCRMRVFTTETLPQKSTLETKTLKNNGGMKDERLSCQLKILTDASVETTYW